MISLTRLNGSPIYLNSDLIKYAEASPDTMLTLIHGEKMVVLESCEQVVERMNAQRIHILRTVAESLPNALDQLNATAAATAHSALHHFTQERDENIVPDPSAIHRPRPQQH